MACPPLREAAPINAVPSQKVTVPVGVPERDTPFTEAVNVIEFPKLEGFEEELTAVLLVPAPMAKMVKSAYKLDDPAGVFTDTWRRPVVAVGSILMSMGRLDDEPPG